MGLMEGECCRTYSLFTLHPHCSGCGGLSCSHGGMREREREERKREKERKRKRERDRERREKEQEGTAGGKFRGKKREREVEGGRQKKA